MQTIDVKRLADVQGRTDVDVIDVRMPTEFRQVHAQRARNVPLEALDPNTAMASGIAKMPWNQCERGGSCSA
jgi:rhodanese-related sulfurtransferase